MAVQEGAVYENVPPACWAWKDSIRRSLLSGFNAQKYGTGQDGSWPAPRGKPNPALALPVYALALPFCVCLARHLVINSLQKGGCHLIRLCAIGGIDLWNKRGF